MKPTTIYSPEPARGWSPWGALAPILAIVFVAATDVPLSFYLESLGLVNAKGDPTGMTGLFAFLIFPFALLGLVVFAWLRFVERRSPATIGLAARGGVKGFLFGHAVGLATSSFVVASIWIAGGYQARELFRAFSSPAAMLKIGGLLFAFALQSSVEELLFRGWLLSAVARKLGVVLGVALTSAVFTLLHYGPRQPWLVTLSTLLFSLFTCFWALRRESIWGVMGWHSGWNWLLAVGFEVPITGLDAKLPALLVRLIPSGPAVLTGGSQGPEGSLLCVLFFILASACFLWDRRIGSSRKP